MGANFPRVKTWVSTEDVTYSDLNAEFDNILNNLTAANVDDYSANVTQMQSTADPGEVGTESLATSVAGEIQRLRKLIGEITGEDQWYESPVSSLLGLANAVGTGLTDNRLVSGLVISGTQQPGFLIANGAARTVKVDGTPTNFKYYVDGTEYTISTDVTLTGLTAAPSTNNTCLINDGVAADQYWTLHAGEDGTEIPVDNMGSEISALVGKFAAFKLNNGTTNEYFTAYVKSTTALTKAKRGYFFDSTNAAVPRISYMDNDTITLLKLTWVFAKTDGTLTATYNNPVWSDDEPTSPSVGDYWFDISANTWKVYGVGSYAVANAILIGVCAQDTTNTICARSFEFFAAYDTLNTVELFAESNSQVKSRTQGAMINVFGSVVKNEHSLHTWDMTLDLDSGVTEAASTYYYFYITETGDKLISNVKPYDRREDLLGYYHPHKSWRCVGRAFNNASSNLEQVESYYRRYDSVVVRSIIAADVVFAHDGLNILSGASASIYLPPAASCKGKRLVFKHNGTSLSQVYTLDGYLTETIEGSTTYPLYTANECVVLESDGSGWWVTQHFTDTDWIAFPSVAAGTLITGTGSNPAYGTVVNNYAYWRRNGVNADIRWDYRQSAVSVGVGSGNYLFNLPSGLTMASSVIVNTSTGNTSGAGNDSASIGEFHGSYATTSFFVGILQAYSTTQFKAYISTVNTAVTSAIWGPATYDFAVSAAAAFNIRASVPIANWKP